MDITAHSVTLISIIVGLENMPPVCVSVAWLV